MKTIYKKTFKFKETTKQSKNKMLKNNLKKKQYKHYNHQKDRSHRHKQ